jgi:hypothetical protein
VGLLGGSWLCSFWFLWQPETPLPGLILEAPADLQITVFQELDPSLDHGNALEH